MLLKKMDLLRNTVDIHISQKFSGSSLAAEFSKLLITPELGRRERFRVFASSRP